MSGGFGWIRDDPDSRDHRYVVPTEVLGSLPKQTDLRSKLPPAYNQGHINSCTANALAAAMQFDEIRQGFTSKRPSRLFIYYNERAIEGTVGKDDGARIRDGIKSVARRGDCPETLWPYDKRQLNLRPPQQCYKRARRYRAVSYQRMRNRLEELKCCLASGYPFVFGFTVFKDFEGRAVRKTGRLDMPGKGEETVGLHAVLAVGYDDSYERFLVRNSWGRTWGIKGYFTMPYEYLLDRKLAHDFWTIRFIR